MLRTYFGSSATIKFVLCDSYTFDKSYISWQGLDADMASASLTVVLACLAFGPHGAAASRHSGLGGRTVRC